MSDTIDTWDIILTMLNPTLESSCEVISSLRCNRIESVPALSSPVARVQREAPLAFDAPGI